jgi:hypothetical protein
MEDVLEVYHRPYDPKRPVVCLDETSKELHATPHGTQPVTLQHPRHEDYEYKREGVRNLFLWVEPLAGRRQVTVTARRTAKDFADQIRSLVDEAYPDVDQIVLVVDNLNTHGPSALYQRFAPAEAFRLMHKIEWHYTPEHGSWLNMAEIELSVLATQCLKGRVATEEALRRIIAAWVKRRNAARAIINWQFTAEDALINHKRLYPKLEQY